MATTAIGASAQIDNADLDKIVELTQQIKRLETEKKLYTEKLKATLVNAGSNELIYSGHKFQIVKSYRNTFKKNMKDSFIAFLAGKGLKSCIALTTDINKEALDTEVNLGNLTQDEINLYMTSTEVTSLKVTL